MPLGNRKRNIALIVGIQLILVVWCGPLLAGQASAQDGYAAKRKQAVELFRQDKHLEALPLFEELAKANPKDSGVLVGLAASLVSQAATIDDESAAAKVRVRARKVLLQAQALGDNSTLTQNLLQLLPEDGIIHYSKDPANAAMRDGEAAFSRRDFDQAIKAYSRALELNPKNYSAALYIGDSYFAMKDFSHAEQWYDRAIQIDPNQETAFRYSADMYTKNGDLEKARTRAVQAVVADPYNGITWRGLEQWANAAHVKLTAVTVKVPGKVSQKDDKNITITVDPANSEDRAGAWLAYNMARALWRGEKFKKQFPGEKQYRHSLAEEADALTTAATVYLETSTKDKDKKSQAPAVPKDTSLVTLLRLHQAGMIEPYVLLNAADEGIARDYDAYREKNREKLEQYMKSFVVPEPAPAK
jgi:tetratricopeptide (TPR) repeat protein